MAALKTKENVEHNVEFAKGGNTKMFGPQAAGPDRPGNTGKDSTSAPGPKYASGGSHKMAGYSPSIPAKAGITGAR
jgi:hypothetical protein